MSERCAPGDRFEKSATPMLDRVFAVIRAHEKADRYNKARSIGMSRNDWKRLMVEFSLTYPTGGADPARRFREHFGIDGMIGIDHPADLAAGEIRVWGREEPQRWAP